MSDRAPPPNSIAPAVSAAWRQESARVVAGLMRLTRDLGLAEDFAQDALLAALEQWPVQGIPEKPGAWLMAVGRRRAVDYFRHADVERRKAGELELEAAGAAVPDPSTRVHFIEDDVLRLIFLACHPALAMESRVVLTLRLVGGLTTAEIARGLLVKDATIGQRVSRAKRRLADIHAEFDLPTGAARKARLGDVMAVIYLLFNEGHTASAGSSWTRPDLCFEAIRLARLLAGLASNDSEVHGLLALLVLQASRLGARVDAQGHPVLLEDQDRERWDQDLIREGRAALAYATELGDADGPYLLQARIAACHASASTAADTDWAEIARLYDRLAVVTPSPVIEVNRAVAHGRAYGPAAGLTVLADVGDLAALARSPLLPAVRGDLLLAAGRVVEAAEAFRTAAARSANQAERELLLRRAKDSS